VDFVGAKFYCPHALANGNYHIQIRAKMMQFHSAVLPTSFPCINTKYDNKITIIMFNFK